MLLKFVSNMNEKERRIFYIAAALVTLALLDRLFLGPILNHLESLDEQIEQQKISIERDRRILAYKDKIERETEAFSEYFTQRVPDDDVVNAEFLSNIEKMATRSEVNLVKSNPSHLEKSDQVNRYFASVDCEGAFEDVLSFMHTVNSSENLLRVVEFNMTPRRGGEAGEVKASMSIVKLVVH